MLYLLVNQGRFEFEVPRVKSSLVMPRAAANLGLTGFSQLVLLCCLFSD